MVYVKLDEMWKNHVKSKDLGGKGYDFVVVEMENGNIYSAQLFNEKKLKMMEDVDLENIKDIKPR